MPDDLTLEDIILRTHSYRNHHPDDYWVVGKKAGKPDTRDVLKRMEGGRFYPMLKEAHNVFVRLDIDEQRTFTRRNPDLVMWIAVWGWLEDLNTVRDMDALARKQLGEPERPE